MTTWDDYPLRLNMRHMAELFDVHVDTVRKRVQSMSPLQPAPSFLKPYGWRREDVRRFFDTASVPHQRRALARHTAAEGGRS